MSSTLQVIRNRVLDDLNLAYTRPSIDSLTVTTLLDAGLGKNTNFDGNQFFNWLIHRPDAASSADYYRYCTLLVNTTGAFTHAGTNYADTTATSETWNLIAPGILPADDIDPAINRALEFVSFHTTEPISLAADACMRETGVTSWGTHVNATEAKQTTASRVFPGMGIRSLAVTCTSANGYLPTASIPVTAGEQIFVATLSRVNSGTSATVQLRDVTNSANFGTNPVHSEGTWQYMQQIETVPAGCRAMQVRLQGVGASDVIDWQALWVIRRSVFRYNLPSYLDERYKVDSIAQVGFGMASTGSVTGTVMEGLSILPVELPSDSYSVDFPMPEANPTFVQFHPAFWRQLWERRFGPRFGATSNLYAPLVVQMRLPYSERGTLSLEADATACPLHLIVPAAEIQLLQSCQAARNKASKQLAQVQAEFKAAIAERATTGPAKRQRVVGYAQAPN